ncbi:Zinc finger protein 76 [Plakobranchus ocellatus]|uniref:Zinc finger protein 76 n=1 Tax=Plakobranchus ocellatus TaxID=259542 RepID=A0AAV3YZZ9_9GAST|nr:Zinc finger protein 76 [Plakobranchus ocellatus]
MGPSGAPLLLRDKRTSMHRFCDSVREVWLGKDGDALHRSALGLSHYPLFILDQYALRDYIDKYLEEAPSSQQEYKNVAKQHGRGTCLSASTSSQLYSLGGKQESHPLTVLTRQGCSLLRFPEGMIVSGFTQKKRFPVDPPMEVEGQHSHCSRCCRVDCNKFADQVTSCEMIVCELCGWKCHRCKQVEHGLTCPEERVACVNKEYGCPHQVKRSRMASHLPVCPASVVCCSEEWSRWPMHAREKGLRMPLPQSKTYIDCGQLDVGLAMRDQRMLIDSLRAPRKLRRTLRNSLTQKYPAAPFTSDGRSHELDIMTSSDTSHTLSEDETDTPWDLTKTPAGLSESIKSKLFLVTKAMTDSVAAALDKSASALSSSSSSLSQDRLSDIPEAASSSSHDRSVKHIDYPGVCSFRSSSLPPDHTFMSNCIAKETAVDKSESTNYQNSNHIQSDTVEAQENSQAVFPINNIDEKVVSKPVRDQSTERSVRSSLSSDRISEASSKSKSTLQDMGGTQLHKLLGQKVGGDRGFDVSSESNDGDAAPAEICLHQMLGVNIGFECINKYVQKSPSMYTFICAQNFRRDQYRWHFKNVHQEIHQGMHGWLEQRCPLAYLGCTFSFMRLEPAQPNMQVYHSWLQESFGVRSTTLISEPKSSSLETGQCEKLDCSLSEKLFQEKLCAEEMLQAADTATSAGCPKNEHGNSTDILPVSNPSISNLADIDKEFDYIPGKNSNSENHKAKHNLAESNSRDINTNNLVTEKLESCSLSGEAVCGPMLRMTVQPTIYSGMNWDSKVLFEYEVEEDDTERKASFTGYNLLDLPFEVLQNIAKHLDSFSLCNLALTSHLLRDVCCSLLDDFGIVVLNWQRHKSDNNISWKVASKRWMFSTSFEPIRSWRFKQSVPHMGDHLKVCPFNKDILRHSGKIHVIPWARESTWNL